MIFEGILNIQLCIKC